MRERRPIVSIAILFILTIFVPVGTIGCGRTETPRRDFTTIRKRLDEIFNSWWYAEVYRAQEQYAPAREKYEKARVVAEDYLEDRPDDLVVSRLRKRIDAILATEPMSEEKIGQVRLDGTFYSLEGARGAIAMRAEEIRRIIDAGGEPAKFKSEQMYALTRTVRNIGRQETNISEAAMEDLLGYGWLSVVYLRELSEDEKNEGLRIAVAGMLGKVEDYKELAGLLLVRLLNDPSASVVSAAAKGIGARMAAIRGQAASPGGADKDKGKTYEFAVAPLRAVINLPEDRRKRQAELECLNAIAWFDRPVSYRGKEVSAAELVLMEYLDPKKTNVEIRNPAVHALGRVQRKSKIAKDRLIAVFLEDPSAVVREPAAEILGEIAWPEAIRALQAEVTRSGTEYEVSALGALARTGSPLAMILIWEALQFGNDSPGRFPLRRFTLEKLELHARHDKSGWNAVNALAAAAEAYTGDVRKEALNRLAAVASMGAIAEKDKDVDEATKRQLAARATEAIHTMIGLALNRDPVVAILAADRLRRLNRDALRLDHKNHVRYAVDAARTAGRYQVALHLAGAISDRVDEAAWKDVRAKAMNVDRALWSDDQTACRVRPGDSQEEITVAYGQEPAMLEHHGLGGAPGAYKALVYYHEGLTFHMRANDETNLSRGFKIYEIEVLPNFDKKFLNLRIGDPTQTVIENLGVPLSDTLSDDGHEVLFYEKEGKRISVYCDTAVRKIIYRNPGMLHENIASRPTPIPQLSVFGQPPRP